MPIYVILAYRGGTFKQWQTEGNAFTDIEVAQMYVGTDETLKYVTAMLDPEV